ncbi:hypothetical protein PCASD_26684 [Puccinia coronata f. sp. avenae]|uniref:RING-type domain-containing protein n=1 Tax=Puccinia coronata f. sp. avenae TaxID=200324 RepID=A0A2N5RU33_9BASI|nr:hypothetical protein PCASD_26684 [Puccinia coronata f. sp. avenae]
MQASAQQESHSSSSSLSSSLSSEIEAADSNLRLNRSSDPTYPSSSSSKHLIYKPLTLDSGYSVCSACYDFYPHELPPPSSTTTSQPPTPQYLANNQYHQISTAVLTTQDHLHLAQPSPTVNFILQKVVQIAHTFISLQSSSSPSSSAGQKAANSLGASLRGELECPLCSLVFESPVTISCGHTFCRLCFLRARDHADHCPVCRQPFLMGHQLVPGVDLLIAQIIHQSLAQPRHSNHRGPRSEEEELEEEEEEEEEECGHINLEANHTIPLMVCSIGFPEVPMFLQIMEPRYKLLIRRSLSTDRKFGIVVPAFDAKYHSSSPSRTDFSHPYEAAAAAIVLPASPPHRQDKSSTTPPATLPVHSFGTILEIRKHETAVDGRMLIEARGCERFWVEAIVGSLDGYLVAKIHTFNDIPIQENPPPSSLSSSSPSYEELHHRAHDAVDYPPTHHPSFLRVGKEESTEKLMNTCKQFLEILRSGSTPWILERLYVSTREEDSYNTFGPMPDQPPEFTYWIAMILPISDQHKTALLPIISYRTRLKILVHWIHILKSQWSRRGCPIL